MHWLPYVDLHVINVVCRLWVPNEAPSPAAFVQSMLLTATAAPAQYAALMNQSGIIVSVGLAWTCCACHAQHLCSSECVKARTKGHNTPDTGRRTWCFLLLLCSQSA